MKLINWLLNALKILGGSPSFPGDLLFLSEFIADRTSSSSIESSRIGLVSDPGEHLTWGGLEDHHIVIRNIGQIHSLVSEVHLL